MQGHGPVLVLLHGLALSHLSWGATFDALAEHFTVYSLDLPGFGYSDKPAGYASARQAAAFVDRFLSTVGLERATVIGHSTGGAAALWLAVEYPAHVERLVLVNLAEIGEAAAIFRLLAQPIVGDVLLKMTTPATMRVLMADTYVQKYVVTPELAALPSASLEVIADAGHVPHEEQAARFSRIVLDWLDRTPRLLTHKRLQGVR